MLREHLPEPTKILVPENAARFVTETLHLMGLSDLCEAPKSKNLLPDRFYFCAPTAMTGAHNPIGYDWLRKTFKSHMGAAGSGSPGTRYSPSTQRPRSTSWQRSEQNGRKGLSFHSVGLPQVGHFMNLEQRAHRCRNYSEAGRLSSIRLLTKAIGPSRRMAFKRTVTLSRVEPTIEAISR